MEENTFRKYPKVSQILKLYLYAIIDNFGYRQLNTIYKVEAVFGYRKNKSSWGTIKRRKFVSDEKGGKADTSGKETGSPEPAADSPSETLRQDVPRNT
jgi:hypothetical protein